MGDEDARTDAGRGAASIALDQSYDEYPRTEAAFQAFLDGSLNPRGPDSLFDLLGALDLPANAAAVDVGCGEGRDAIELSRRFGLRIHGIDPVQRNIERAAALADNERLSEAVEFRLGLAEAIPLPDASVDLVRLRWTRK